MKNGLLQITAFTLALASLSFFGGCKDPAAGGSGSGSTASSGSTNKFTSTEKIKIGMVASLNGDQRPWGTDCQAGGLLAVKLINDAGGIGGKEVVLTIEDSNSKPEEGKSAASKLVGDGVIGVLGEVASGITQQMKLVTMEAGVPLVAIGATNPDVTKNSNGLVSRVCYTDDLQGPVMAKFAFDKGLRRVAVMTDKKLPYSTGLSKTFIARFKELGGEIVAEEFYQQGETQFGGQLTSIKGKNPDGIFMSGYFTEIGPMSRQIRQQGMKDVVLMGGDGWDSADLISNGGDAIVGGFFCNHYNDKEDRPEVQKFLTDFKAANNGSLPGTTMGALGYDATALMLDALQRLDKAGKELNSKNLAEEIMNTENFKGVSGDITLKGTQGDPAKRALVVEVQKDGFKFSKAYTPEEALAK